jgi:hypothetical protein
VTVEWRAQSVEDRVSRQLGLGPLSPWGRDTLVSMNTDDCDLDWNAAHGEPVPFERLQPGARYRIVIADC